MLEMFLSVLEEELQIEINPQRAPIARMCRIMNKLESLTSSAAQLLRAAESGDVAFWNCSKCGMLNYESWQTCAKCNAPHPKSAALS
jgi:rubrerythrin